MNPSIKGILGIAAFILLWFIISSAMLLRNTPNPILVLSVIVGMFLEGQLIPDVYASVFRIGIGFLVGAGLGVLFGIIFGIHSTVESYFMPLIDFFRPIPPIAWVPISIIWFGIGDLPAIFLVGLGSFFPVFSATLRGIQNVSEDHIKLAKSFGAKKHTILFHIILKSAIKDIFTGLYIGLGFAWMIVITAEMVGATSGLGYMIQLNRILLNPEAVIAGMMVIGLIGFCMLKLLSVLKVSLVPWVESDNGVL